MNLANRDAMLHAALSYTKDLTGEKRDTAVFDYLVGAYQGYRFAMAEYAGGLGQDLPDVPNWLWVIGVRGGDRIAEIKGMTAEQPTAADTTAQTP